VLVANGLTGCGSGGGGGVICLERQGAKVSCTYRGVEKNKHDAFAELVTRF
jgi:hypothetical protein